MNYSIVVADFSEKPEKDYEYTPLKQGGASMRMWKDFEQTETGWQAKEIFIPLTYLSEQEIASQIDLYFAYVPEIEPTTADLIEAINILTDLVLGG